MARKLTVEELQTMIQEELGEPRDPAKLKIKQKGWGEAELEEPIDWIKILKIKENLIKAFE